MAGERPDSPLLVALPAFPSWVFEFAANLLECWAHRPLMALPLLGIEQGVLDSSPASESAGTVVGSVDWATSSVGVGSSLIGSGVVASLVGLGL